mmetsp:Transcript_8147/g.16094  ORF Transcript_8147/g.16094 Transcript_8147/m.16094 type:complete len:118 (-) Transcript_8147:847-1200(-)
MPICTKLLLLTAAAAAAFEAPASIAAVSRTSLPNIARSPALATLISHSAQSTRSSPIFAKTDDEKMKERMRAVGSNENFGTYRRIENSIYLVGGLVTVLTPIILGIWAYNEGYLTPQ